MVFGGQKMGKNNKNVKKELSIKSMMLFKSLEMCQRIILDLGQKDEKRIKSLKTIMDTYRMTVKPFIDDEPKEYQDKVYTAIKDKTEYIEGMITSKVTVETLNMMVEPIMSQLKSAVATCKIDLDKVNTILNIEK
jgi:hypothetical protein